MSDGRRARGALRRDALVAATVELLVEQGPGVVSHRAVAARAGASLSATTYYFADLDELLAAAGQEVVRRWAEHARATVARRAGAATDDGSDDGAVGVLVDMLVDAVLPAGDVRSHYVHLVGAGALATLATAYAEGRSGLDAAVDALGLPLPAAVLVALVDGAAVAALSEGRDVRAHARTVVAAALGR